VKMWFVLDNTDDGAFDNTIECYGSLRINGDLYWHIPREQADRNKREAGQQLEISSSPHTLKEFIFDRPTIDYEIFLRDADDRSGDDDVYKSVSQIRTLNLQQDTTSVLQYRNPKTGEASRLFIRVEQM
jgi:transcription termination factor Rho